jgi:regulator of sigma E protease
VWQPRAILSPPVAGSLAEQAGLQGGETVRRAALAGDELEPVDSFDDLHWLLTRGALDGQDVMLEVARAPGGEVSAVTLPMSKLDVREPDARMFHSIGIVGPLVRPEIGEVMPGGAAARAGLRAGDLVLGVDGAPVRDGQRLRELIRASGAHGQPPEASWQIRRAGDVLTLHVRPERYDDKGQQVGRIGAMVGSAPDMVIVRQGVFGGLWSGARRVWEVSALTLKVMGRLVTGQVSIKNLSGPIGIADYAGKSAAMGMAHYLGFLALLSVSLGVLNLLPVPVLDGGQLMYYLWEAVTGKPVTGVWFERLQYLGVTLLLVMMAVATFNDVVSRIG